jgi:hypothetical protein
VKGDVFSKSQCLQSDNEKTQIQAIPYASAVGSLIYAQVCTQYDIAYIVGILRRYLSDPGLNCWTAANKVLRYLNGTKDFILTYRRSNMIDAVGYSDLNLIGCSDNRISTSGYTFYDCRRSCFVESVKQTLTGSSTMEAKYIACYQTSYQAIWI